MSNHQKLFNDSTYGSFSGFLSSNSSSYTMSLSDSEFPEEPPSTSGCSSSDFANSSHQKEKKKERLKQYLKQLKQMVAPESNIGGQMSTIGALKHVLDSMQKNKDESQAKTEETESEKCIRTSTPFPAVSESEDDLKFLSLKSQDDLQILVSTRGLKIVQVTPNLKKILGYPLDSWTGRELTSFLHRKDVVTVNSSYVNDDIDRFDSPSTKFEEEGAGYPENPKRVIYFRLRHYKGLRKGFGLDKKDQYTSFQACVSLRTSSRCKESNTDNLKQYVLFECRPLTSAYKIWSEMTNEKKVFSTRHSLFCSYTYIHPNAIQLLGFLPQDMVGMSIFDFYHPEDFEQLYSIYKQVVTSKSVTVSSPQIRFRTYNGDWIYVKTEWSRFINPWSKRLEFIIGQHSVTKGPKNIDIFSPPVSQECIAEESDQYLKNLRLIRKLLLQPVVDEAKSVALNIIDEEQEDVSVSLTPDKEQSGNTTDESRKKVLAVRGDIQCGHLLDENSSGMYEQLNYTNNIKRFLLSQPKTYSSASDKRSGSYTDDSNAIDSDEVPDFEVDLPLPKPPSFCSSTKVLVSEKEEMMVPSPSCQTEEIGEETSREVQYVDPTPEPHNVLLSLTQETLLQHTKRQEKIYLQQAKQDKNLVLLNVTSKHSVMQESSHGLKRVHSPDADEILKVKSFKAEDSSLLHPPFPITTRNDICKPQNQLPKIALPDLYRLPPNTMYHTGGMPVVQLVPNKLPYTTTVSSSIPATGIPLFPRMVGGFYQPMAVLQYSVSGMNWTSADGTKPSISQGIFTQAGNKEQTTMSISDTSSQENTSSSFMYLLELSNHSEGDLTKKKKNISPKLQRANQRHAEPPWLFGVMWDEVVQMRYTMPRRKFNRVMKEDRDALNIMKQSEAVLSQMHQCKEEAETKDDALTLDEEADYLFMIEPDLFKDDSSSDSACSRELSGELQTKIKFPTIIESSISDNVLSESSSSNKMESISDSNQDSSSVNDDQEKKSDSECDSLQKSSFNDSLIDVESTCSKSSDLTPSDARSTDEKGSSMKESDTQSSKLSEGNKDSESENDLTQTKNQSQDHVDENNFDIFFVKNPTKFKNSKHGFWINEADLNEKIQNEFTLKVNNQNDILMRDAKRLREMKQSSVVKEQLSTLLEHIGSTSQNEKCTCSDNLSSDKTKCTSCRNKTKTKDSFFEDLFMQPLISEDNMPSEQSLRDTPDMEDLFDIFDPLD